MHIHHPETNGSLTVNDLFFDPINQVFAHLENRHPCPELSDGSWLEAGILRCLEEVRSGRGFLQEYGLRLEKAPKISNYFESLKSERRGRLAREASLEIAELAESMLPDRLKDLPGLENYTSFAADGHWHRGASHDPKHKGAKVAAGHFYSLNLHTHTLRHLAASEYHKEHDMHVLKRLKPGGLRQGVRRGQRVLMVYDKAAIDMKFWQRCRKECAVYFLSRPKDGMVFELGEELLWDRGDSLNAGVVEDRRVKSTEGMALRLVTYIEPESGEVFEFLTNVMDLPPGVIVELYRRRWEVEKTFDELKNKLGEKQSWSSSLQAKNTQGQLTALTHNLLVLMEGNLEKSTGLTNEAEDCRREERRLESRRRAVRAGRQMPRLLNRAKRAAVLSVKFIRWLRGCLKTGATAAVALPLLQASYARL